MNKQNKKGLLSYKDKMVVARKEGESGNQLKEVNYMMERGN